MQVSVFAKNFQRMIFDFVKKIYILKCSYLGKICICLELMICEIENSYKRRLKLIFTTTLECSESTWAHVDIYEFVGGLIDDHNEGLVVFFHRNVRHCTCKARMQVVIIPTSAHFSLCGESFL